MLVQTKHTWTSIRCSSFIVPGDGAVGGGADHRGPFVAFDLSHANLNVDGAEHHARLAASDSSDANLSVADDGVGESGLRARFVASGTRPIASASDPRPHHPHPSRDEGEKTCSHRPHPSRDECGKICDL